jgi:co-chaperonin GroES (HSP10)
MRPINGRIIVKREGDLNKTINIGGRELILDPAYRPYHNAVQEATVIASDPESDTQPGDKVYVHHFIQNQEHRLQMEGEISWLERGQVFCRVRDGEIKALMNYVFVSPVMFKDVKAMAKTKEGFLLTQKGDTDFVDRLGRVEFASDMAYDAGLNPGDYVIFGRDCEYDIKVEGKLYFRMELRDVITVIDSLDSLTKVV